MPTPADWRQVALETRLTEEASVRETLAAAQGQQALDALLEKVAR